MSLWKLDKKEHVHTMEVSDSFLTEFFKTLFVEQERSARVPKTIPRENNNTGAGSKVVIENQCCSLIANIRKE